MSLVISEAPESKSSSQGGDRAVDVTTVARRQRSERKNGYRLAGEEDLVPLDKREQRAIQ